MIDSYSDGNLLVFEDTSVYDHFEMTHLAPREIATIHQKASLILMRADRPADPDARWYKIFKNRDGPIGPIFENLGLVVEPHTYPNNLNVEMRIRLQFGWVSLTEGQMMALAIALA